MLRAADQISQRANSLTMSSFVKDSAEKGKAPVPAQEAIPVSFGNGNADQYQYQSQYQYPEASINYDQMNAPPADGTPLYPMAGESNPNLKRFRLHGCQDLWAAVVFVLFFSFTIVWSVVTLCTYDFNSPSENETAIKADAVDGWGAMWLVGLVLISGACSMVSAVLMLLLARRFSKEMIYVANILTIAMYAVSMILAFVVLKEFVVGILMIVLVVLQVLWFICARSRIPFAALLLKTASLIISRYPAIFIVNILLIAVIVGYMVLWGFGIAKPIQRQYNDTGNGGDIAVIVLMVFTFLWFSQVVTNVMHVTASGLVATWYYAGFDNMPRNPTLSAFKRSTTTSFGSICFGSLVVAIIEFVRWLVRSARANDNDGCGAFLLCIMDCLLSLLDSLVQYFNRYAFVHVAIYGCGYIEAAKRTFQLCKQCGFAAYFNDCLVVPTLQMFSLGMSLLLGLIFGLCWHTWVVGVYVFFVSLAVHQVFFVAVDSAVTTIFVCFAESPEALNQSDPVLYAGIYAADGGATGSNAQPPV